MLLLSHVYKFLGKRAELKPSEWRRGIISVCESRKSLTQYGENGMEWYEKNLQTVRVLIKKKNY